MNSPIQLANYRVKKFYFDILDDIEVSDIHEAEIDLNVDYEIFSESNDKSIHRIDLLVELYPSQEGETRLPFSVEIILQGIFNFQSEVEFKEKAYHLNISAPSMLYGIARNMVHQMTGQTNYGSISIPSVQFSEIAKQKTEEIVQVEGKNAKEN